MPTTDLDYSSAYVDSNPGVAGLIRPVLPPVGMWMEAPGIGNRATGTPTLNELRAVPWVVPRTSRWDRAGIENKTVGGAGSITRIGLYRDNGAGYPGALYVDFGTFDSTVAAMLANTVDFTVAPGIWWAAAVAQIAAPGWETTSNFNWLVNTQDPSVGSASAGYSQAGVTGALPATFTTTFFSTSNAPVVSFRRRAD